MNTTNCFGYIHIGLIVRLLLNINSSDSVKLVNEEISKLEGYLKLSILPVSQSAYINLVEITTAKDKLKLLKETDKIGDEIAKLFNSSIYILEQTIVAEARLKKLYIIPERRYNGDYLIKHPDKLLKESIFGKLSDIAKFDFAAACRCLSFGEATACAFHILRATEDTLKQYYFKHKKTKRLAKPMWGPMTNELRNKKTQKPSESILNALDVVRVSYRNPTQHPLVTYDIDSSQDLFGVCIDLINKMAQEL